jgi:hypothetical protein
MHVFLDIETLRCSREEVLSRLCAEIAPPSNYKSEEAISKWWATTGAEKREEAIARTALDGTFGELLCVGFAVDDDPPMVLMQGRDATGEVSLLETVNAVIDRRCRETFGARFSDAQWDTRVTWVGHNIADFDLRFWWQRACINGSRIPFKLPLERYPKGPWVFDTMKEWAGWGKWIKQHELEMAFGLTRSDPLADGSEVQGAWQAGQFGDIEQHCREDVRLLREIHRRIS